MTAVAHGEPTLVFELLWIQRLRPSYFLFVAVVVIIVVTVMILNPERFAECWCPHLIGITAVVSSCLFFFFNYYWTNPAALVHPETGGV